MHAFIPVLVFFLSGSFFCVPILSPFFQYYSYGEIFPVCITRPDLAPEHQTGIQCLGGIYSWIFHRQFKAKMSQLQSSSSSSPSPLLITAARALLSNSEKAIQPQKHPAGDDPANNLAS